MNVPSRAETDEGFLKALVEQARTDPKAGIQLLQTVNTPWTERFPNPRHGFCIEAESFYNQATSHPFSEKELSYQTSQGICAARFVSVPVAWHLYDTPNRQILFPSKEGKKCEFDTILIKNPDHEMGASLGVRTGLLPIRDGGTYAYVLGNIRLSVVKRRPVLFVPRRMVDTSFKPGQRFMGEYELAKTVLGT